MATCSCRTGDIIVLQGDLRRLPEVLREWDCLPLVERKLRLGSVRHGVVPLVVLGAAMLTTRWGGCRCRWRSLRPRVLVVMAGALPLREVYNSLDAPILIMLAALIPVSDSLRATGGTDLIANWLSDTALLLPAWGAVALIMVAAMAVTPFLNNAATVLVMAPIAASFANDLGYRPEAFLMAVAIGAGCDFLTPIGHQCNTLVMGPGGYRFGDYWRLGLPLSTLVVLIGVPMLMMVWPPFDGVYAFPSSASINSCSRRNSSSPDSTRGSNPLRSATLAKRSASSVRGPTKPSTAGKTALLHRRELEQRHFAVARVALDPLEGRLDRRRRPLQHLHEEARVEHQRPGDIHPRIVAAAGIENRLDRGGQLRRRCPDAVDGMIDKTMQRAHGVSVSGLISELAISERTCSGVSGRPVRYPCTTSQPFSRISSSCSAVSTPSAMVVIPRLRPRAAIARTIAALSLSFSMARTKDWSILILSNGTSAGSSATNSRCRNRPSPP